MFDFPNNQSLRLTLKMLRMLKNGFHRGTRFINKNGYLLNFKTTFILFANHAIDEKMMSCSFTIGFYWFSTNRYVFDLIFTSLFLGITVSTIEDNWLFHKET